MKKFCINIFLFFLPVIFFLIITDHIITQGLRKSNWGEYKEWNQIFGGQINADLIINGSSRALAGISPAILDSILEINTFNLAMNASEFFMTDVRYSIYKKYNTKPKIVIQVLDLHSLRKSKNLPRPEQYLPYYNEGLLKKAIKSYSDFSNIDYIIPSFRYLYKYQLQFVGLFEYFNIKRFSNDKYKGYKRMNVLGWDGLTEKFNKQNPDGISLLLDTASVKNFESFIKKCKEDKIKLILVYAPDYFSQRSVVLNRNEIFDIYKFYSNKYEIPFLDYSTDSISYDSTLFYNSQHLNARGSDVFTKKLANDIKKLLLSN